MHRQSCPGTLRLLGVVFAVTVLVVPGACGQPLRATVVHVEGVGHLARHGQGWQDRRGARPRTLADRHPDQSGGAAQRHAAPGQGTGTVLATVVAVDTLTKRVKVQDTSRASDRTQASAKDRQIGEQVTLIVPR